MKRIKLTLILAIPLLVFSNVNLVANAKEVIYIDNISDERKLLYGEKETFISCWSGITGTVFLDLKVSGKWVQKASAKLKKDTKTCPDKGYSGLGKFIWTPNELSTIKGEGRSYILEFRQRFGSIKKPLSSGLFTMPIYRTSNDLIADFADVFSPVPTPTATSLPTPTPTPTPTQVQTLGLNTGQMYSGVRLDYPNEKWVAIKLSNNSNSKILKGSSIPLVSFIDAEGAVVDSSRISTPSLLPGESGWLATTQFNTKNAVRAVIEYQTPKESSIALDEFPTITGVTIGNGDGESNKKSIQMTIRNNSQKYFLNQYSNLFAVILGANGVPIFSHSSYPYVWIAPGGSATVKIGLFTMPSGMDSIEVSIKPSLCKVPNSMSNDYNNCIE
jgi:hypothetical protein